MKKILIAFIYIVSIIPISAQNKKELISKIAEIETKNIELKKTIESLDLQIKNNSSSINILSNSIENISKTVSQNSNNINKLNKRTDSLSFLTDKNDNNPLITNPKSKDDSIKYCVQQYLASKNWQKRLDFIVNPEENKSKLQARYGNSAIQNIINKNNINITQFTFKEKDYFNVNAGKNFQYYVIKSNNNYKIDWEASIGYNKSSIKTLKATLSRIPTTFRVFAELDNFYTHNSKYKQNTHWNVKVYNRNYDVILCYILKSSSSGKKIFDILKDGKKHKLIIELKLDTREDKSGGTGIITKLISESWIN